MKWHLVSFLLFFIFCTPQHLDAAADIRMSVESTIKQKETNKITPDYHSLKRNLEQQLGRKLKWSERLGLRALTVHKSFSNEDSRKANNHALVGFILGISSLILLPLLSIPGYMFSNSALIKEKLNPGILEGGNKGLAKAGLILSIIGLVYLLLIILYIIIIFSSGIYFN